MVCKVSACDNGPGMEVVKAAFVKLNDRENFDLIKVLVRFFASHSYLTSVTAAKYERDIQ